MTTRAAASRLRMVGEYARVTLPRAGASGLLLVNGQAVPGQTLRPVMPFIENGDEDQVTVNVHDWAGRLHFTGPGGLDEVVLVAPTKLAQDPDTAFSALQGMADQLPEIAQRLGYPSELVPAVPDVFGPGLNLADLQGVAARAWKLTQAWQRQPHWTEGRQHRVVRGGTVPDRVDWALTFAEWSRGRFPDHVARDLPRAAAPAGLEALRTLWQALVSRADEQPGGEGLALTARRTLARLPVPTAAPAENLDVITRAARSLLAHLDGIDRRVAPLPAGHACMPDLYELWVQVTVLSALGARSGHFTRNADGRYVGTFHGPGVTVTLNPRLGFQGVGQGVQHSEPDLLAVFETGQALVADVKYRALDRLATEQTREVNRQLLTYMGLMHAATGLVLWPAPQGEAFREAPLPSNRARLLRMRCHPLDAPGAFTDRLRALNLPGVA